jgi:hypothetical protein
MLDGKRIVILVVFVGDVGLAVGAALVVDVDDDLPFLEIHKFETLDGDITILSAIDHHGGSEETNFVTDHTVVYVVLHFFSVVFHPRLSAE